MNKLFQGPNFLLRVLKAVGQLSNGVPILFQNTDAQHQSLGIGPGQAMVSSAATWVKLS